MMNHAVRWKLVLLFLLVVLAVWRPGVLWTVFFAPGEAALGLMALLPTRIADSITYGIDPEGGAASAIPLVGGVSIVFWASLMLAWWIYRRRNKPR